MDYKSGDHIAVALNDPKAAALYFQYVVPLNIPEMTDLPWTSRKPEEWEEDEKFSPISRPGVIVNEQLFRTIPAVLPPNRGDPIGGDPIDIFLRNAVNLAATKVAGISQREFQLWAGAIERLRAFSVYGETLDSPLADNNDPCLTLSALDFIDTRKVPWDQILEFRRDTDRVRKLRRLRGFLFENYEGKPPGFIRDDLERRIYEYEQVTKFWDFPVAEALLRIILTDKSVQLLVGLASGLFGAPIPEAAAAGAAIALAKGALQLGRRRHEVNLERGKPIRYLVEVKQLTSLT